MMELKLVFFLVASATCGNISEVPSSDTLLDLNEMNETFVEPGPFSIVTQEPVVLFSEKQYNDKICNNEPTCHMVKNAPEELRQMGVRNCMCDEECRQYGDCCLDSPFYNETEQKSNYHTFYCSPQELIFMLTRCPNDYTLTDIKRKCHSSTDPLLSDDADLVIPVTNIETKITYGNKYCAQCHGDWNYQSWNISYYCSEDLFANAASSLNLSRDYSWEMTEAAKHVQFDPIAKKFRSSFNQRNYTCSYTKHFSEQLRPYVRKCIPSIAECSHTAKQSEIQKCLSYTQVVYGRNDLKEVYKNKDCAICNGKSEPLKGCKTIVHFYSASKLFSSIGKGIDNTPCGSNVANKFC